MAGSFVAGQVLTCKGYVTRLIFVINRSAGELEKCLGYNTGRLAQGWALLALKERVAGDEFMFAGYSHFSGGRVGNPLQGDARPRVHDDLQSLLGDPTGYAGKFAQENFQLSGSNRIVKIIPTGDADPALSDAERYPVGTGVPQWILTVPKRFVVAVVVGPGVKHLGGGADYPSGFWVDPSLANTV
jgi:hypothetical protein